jgi:hypothetical protein
MDALIGNSTAESQYLAGEREAEIQVVRAELAAEEAAEFRVARASTLDVVPAQVEYEQFISEYGML